MRKESTNICGICGRKKERKMEITLNNRKESIDKNSLTVRELLDYKNFTFKMLVIKINGALVKKDQYETANINQGDNVTVLHLVSGG